MYASSWRTNKWIFTLFLYSHGLAIQFAQDSIHYVDKQHKWSNISIHHSWVELEVNYRAYLSMAFGCFSNPCYDGAVVKALLLQWTGEEAKHIHWVCALNHVYNISTVSNSQLNIKVLFVWLPLVNFFHFASIDFAFDVMMVFCMVTIAWNSYSP